MRAAVLTEVDGPVRVETVAIDSPGPREVLIRTAAAGVCHSDIHVRSGSLPTPLPILLGHESAGTVEAVGCDVVSLRPGDHVVTCLSAFCGTCTFCLSGRSHLCYKQGLSRGPGDSARVSRDGEPLAQFAGIGSFAEQLLVHENATVRVSPDLPLNVAALLGCGVTTGLGAVFNSARVRPGERVVVIGCGGIGLNVVQGAHLAGAAMVIAVDPVAAKRDLARQLGATHVIDPVAGDPVAQVLELTDGGVEHAIEALGRPVTMGQAFGVLERGGTATIIGVAGATESLTVPAFPLMHDRRIQGSCMGGAPFREAIPAYADLYLQGRLQLDRLISSTASLDEVGDIIADFGTTTAARQVIVFDGN
ncbi:Zn-dependent alcohol dehydrogenase [Saccharopolyspora shandongensis]|uniref:Zn-dependent alcohol dehydrogenase n=1 Tax=Saccharopolyspora shandongensis TaxID=418495 RepID=UPI00340971CE